VFVLLVWAKASMAAKVEKVAAVVTVELELKTITPKAPVRRCTATGVDPSRRHRSFCISALVVMCLEYE
jgi:hypothetical protein